MPLDPQEPISPLFQRGIEESHIAGALSGIYIRMKWIVAVLFGLVGLSGCTAPNPSFAQIRQDTANATAAAARDSKAVAQGIVEGLRSKGPLNIDRASKSDLETLPGIDSAAADRIVAGRPYDDSAQLLRRHIVTRAEYDRIASRIEVH